jgi:hypothetical protein
VSHSGRSSLRKRFQAQDRAQSRSRNISAVLVTTIVGVLLADRLRTVLADHVNEPVSYVVAVSTYVAFFLAVRLIRLLAWERSVGSRSGDGGARATP